MQQLNIIPNNTISTIVLIIQVIPIDVKQIFLGNIWYEEMAALPTTKLQIYTELAQSSTAWVMESRERWLSFLDTAARLYKYPFANVKHFFL